MTDAETKLWHVLRAHRFCGASFRRQTPIGPYIVDFVSHQQHLIIEIDGGQHFDAARVRRDRRRDHYLREKGFHVLRFSNLDVLTNREGVLETIAAAITARPLPSPPPQAGEGARERFGAPSPMEHSGEARSTDTPSPVLPHKLGTKQNETPRVHGNAPIAEQGQ